MASTPRSIAQTSLFRYVLTVYQSYEHQQLGDAVLCACTGPGEGTTLDGRWYPPALDAGLKVSILWGLTAQAVGISVRWDREIDPVDIDLRYCLGELARVDDGQTWESRLILVTGRVTSVSWGDAFEALTFTLAGTQITDAGDFYPPGAELSTDRFPDIGNTRDRDRAKQADGKLPPKVWAPVGTGVHVPVPVVVDEVDADPGVDPPTWRRHLLGYDAPAQSAADEQFRLRNTVESPMFLAGPTSTIYRATPQSDVDALGDTYWYVEGGFRVTYGSASVDWHLGQSTANVHKAFQTQLQEGWQTRGITATDADYLVMISRSGQDIELGDSDGNSVAYTGPNEVNSQGYSIPLPVDAFDGSYWIPTLYGGQKGISSLVDVLLDWLTMVRLPLPVAVGDLECMRSRLGLWSLTYVRLTRGSPWAVLLKTLEVLPIRVYVYDGMIRFRWMEVSNADVVATVDLTEACGLYRMEPVTWLEDEPTPQIQMGHTWSVPLQKYERTISLTGTRTGASGRELMAMHRWRGNVGLARDVALPALAADYEMLELAPGPDLAALWLLKSAGTARRKVTLQADATWRWLAPGDVLELVESAALPAAWWYVEGITYDASGRGEILLSEVSE